MQIQNLTLSKDGEREVEKKLMKTYFSRILKVKLANSLGNVCCKFNESKKKEGIFRFPWVGLN